jgi:hypothetical protein
MTSVRGTPAQHPIVCAARDRALVSATAGLRTPDPLPSDAVELVHAWSRTPDIGALHDVLGCDDPTGALAAVLDLDAALHVEVHSDDGVAALAAAVRRCVQVAAAVGATVARLADGPDLTAAFAAVRAGHTHAWPAGTAEDVRAAVLLRAVLPAVRAAGCQAGWPLLLREEDDGWGFGATFTYDPLPHGACVPGGTVAHTKDAVSVRYDDRVVDTAASQLADRVASVQPIVDPYDWARAVLRDLGSRTALTAGVFTVPTQLPEHADRALARLLDVHTDPHQRRWQAGIDAERAVAAAIESCDVTAVVHGARVAGGDADHVVLGPCAAVVETKHGLGPVWVDSSDAGMLWVSGRRLRGEDGSPVRQVLRQANALAELLEAAMVSVVCVAGMTSAPFVTDGVHVCSATDLPHVLASLPVVLDPAAARALADRCVVD